jgi:hypothetical protein
MIFSHFQRLLATGANPLLRNGAGKLHTTWSSTPAPSRSQATRPRPSSAYA